MVLLDRKKAIPILIGDHKRFLIISGLAGPAKDIGFLTKESPNTFLFGGAMGGALPTSLGLALSRPKEKVLCVSGDGDILMSMGCLATIATTKPKNLIISNVTGSETQEVDTIKDLLIKQIESPVRWRESVIYMIKNGVTNFIEIGPGKVLSGLVKRIDKNIDVNSINKIEDLKEIKIND